MPSAPAAASVSARVPPELAQWLDAMPVPTAVVVTKDKPRIVQGNVAFGELTRVFEGHGQRVDDGLFAALEGTAGSGRTLKQRPLKLGSAVDARTFIVDLTPVADTAALALLVVRETTAVAQAVHLLRRQMIDDPLTGLLNRSGFVELVDARIEEQEGCGVVAVDLMRFSRVNDCMGPLGGDELLVTVARRLKAALRGGDVLARTGANEFAIVAGCVSADELLAVARRVVAALAEPFQLSDFEIKVDAAVGCAFAEERDAEQAMRHAQLALKAAKQTRTVELYRPDTLVTARRRFMLETDLRRAIEQDALELVYQPLVALAPGKVVGFEALARWQHPVLGAIAPTEFIAVAEETGLIVPLGRWVLDRAVAMLADSRLPDECGVAVNLSPSQIVQDDIAVYASEVLRRHAVRGDRLTIELTENIFVAEPDRAARVLDAFKENRVQIAMDDFGTGYSNLASLRRLPIDILKIDRSLVSNMMEDRDKVAIVRAIQSLAQTLDLRVTAEGVETAEEARLLTALGCHCAQGYYYSRPLPAAEACGFVLPAA